MSALAPNPPVLARALKEWAVVCTALEQGRQSVLLRKGGLREDEGTFRVEDQRFFLLPTYEHQRADWLRPEHASTLGQHAVSTIPDGPICISAWAEVARVIRVDSDDAAYRLGRTMITNEAFVQSRLEFNPYDPLYALALRVYRLPAPVFVETNPAYSGCRSWVTLQDEIDIRGSIPTLSDAVFNVTLEKLEAAAASGK